MKFLRIPALWRGSPGEDAAVLAQARCVAVEWMVRNSIENVARQPDRALIRSARDEAERLREWDCLQGFGP